MLTDLRVLSSRLAEATVGTDARIVPVHPTDAALLDLVRPGDVVDVLAVSARGGREPTQERPRVVATNAVVVLVSARRSQAAGDGVVLVALPRVGGQRGGRRIAVASDHPDLPLSASPSSSAVRPADRVSV